MLNFFDLFDRVPLNVWFSINVVNTTGHVACVWHVRRCQYCTTYSTKFRTYVTAQSLQNIWFRDCVIIAAPDPLVTHVICLLVDVVLAFFLGVDPLPLDALDVQHAEEVAVNQLVTHVLRLVIVIKHDQLINWSCLIYDRI